MLSAIIWLMDSLLDKFSGPETYFTLTPHDSYELIKRLTIMLIIISVGIYIGRMKCKQQQENITMEEEKRRVFLATVFSTQHIMNNFLQEMRYFQMEAENIKDFNEPVKALLDESICNAIEQVKRLSAVTELSEDKIKDSVLPKTLEQFNQYKSANLAT